jgi:hypothetical protein
MYTIEEEEKLEKKEATENNIIRVFRIINKNRKKSQFDLEQERRRKKTKK